MPPVGFEPAIPAGERPQTLALDGAATGIGNIEYNSIIFISVMVAACCDLVIIPSSGDSRSSNVLLRFFFHTGILLFRIWK